MTPVRIRTRSANIHPLTVFPPFLPAWNCKMPQSGVEEQEVKS